MPDPLKERPQQPPNPPSREEMRERLRAIAQHGERKAKILDCLLQCITSDRDIGLTLNNSANTIKQHFTEIYQAVGVSDRLIIGFLWRDLREDTGSGEGGSVEA